jgi:hypothetical protein
LTGAGATFPYPIYSKWAEAYKAATGIGLNYQSIGSGGGIRQIKAKTVDFGASDMPLKQDELEKEGLTQFPAIIGGVVPVFNLDEDAVKNNLVLASYGVNYLRIGQNTGKLVAAILHGSSVEMLDPIYPDIQDHDAYLSEKQAHDFGIEIPKDLPYALNILRS